MRFATVACALSVLLAGCGDREADPQAEPQENSTAVAGPAGAIDATVVQCTYTDQASIYNVKAAQWRAEYYGSEDVRSLNLTVWRPVAGGEDQINFVANKGGEQYRINTVEGSEKVGSGRVIIEEDEEGGARFVIDGKDQNGNPLHATVSCGEFVEPAAEGG